MSRCSWSPAQPPGDGGPGPAAAFQVASEALDVGAPRLEQPELVLLALAGFLAGYSAPGFGLRPGGWASRGPSA